MSVELLAVIGLAVLCGVGWLVADIVGQTIAEGAKDSVFHRPSFAERRQRHRGLMLTGYLCGLLALMSWFLWLAVVTTDVEDDAADARLFLALGSTFAVGAVLFLAAWWRKAGRPLR